MTKQFQLHGDYLIQKPEITEPDYKRFPFGLRDKRFTQAVKEWNEYYLSLPRYPISPELKKCIENNKKKEVYELDKDFKLREVPSGGRVVKSDEGIPTHYEQWSEYLAIPLSGQNQAQHGESNEVTDIDIEKQYQEFLRLINLSEDRMHPQQRLQTKQAFYGAVGRLLWLIRDVIGAKSPFEGARDLQELWDQSDLYWKQRSQKPEQN